MTKKWKYDDHGEPTNAQRAEWAEAALLAYKSDIKGESGAADTTDIQDLVSDLLHLMERKIKSGHAEMTQVFAWALRRYSEETKKKANSNWAFDTAKQIEENRRVHDQETSNPGSEHTQGRARQGMDDQSLEEP